MVVSGGQSVEGLIESRTERSTAYRIDQPVGHTFVEIELLRASGVCRVDNATPVDGKPYELDLTSSMRHRVLPGNQAGSMERVHGVVRLVSESVGSVSNKSLQINAYGSSGNMGAELRSRLRD